MKLDIWRDHTPNVCLKPVSILIHTLIAAEFRVLPKTIEVAWILATVSPCFIFGISVHLQLRWSNGRLLQQMPNHVPNCRTQIDITNTTASYTDLDAGLSVANRLITIKCTFHPTSSSEPLLYNGNPKMLTFSETGNQTARSRTLCPRLLTPTLGSLWRSRRPLRWTEINLCPLTAPDT